MNRPDEINLPGIFIDIGQSSLKAVNDGETFEFPLERAENGRLTELGRERLTAALRGFLAGKGATTHRVAWCAIGARGVSLRRLKLPPASRDEFQRLLRLQIESAFPLSPDELAWGWRPVGGSAAAHGGAGQQELLVVAVKKDVLEDYAAILTGCGVAPQFTLAALARAELQPSLPGSCAVLDIGRTHSELVTFENGLPVSIRIVPWGGERVTLAIAQALGASHDEAERLKLTLNQPGVPAGANSLLVERAVALALTKLAEAIRPALAGGKLYLTGKTARDPQIPAMLSGLLGNGAGCESLELKGAGTVATAGGLPVQLHSARAKSPAIVGLMKATAKNSGTPPLVLELNGGRSVVKTARPMVWKWAVAAAVLALAAFLFPYAEAIVMKPVLEKRLAALQSDSGRLATIDREYEFLKFVKTNQPPYLDVLYLLAKSSPQGTHLDGFSLGRHEQVTIRLKLATAEQLTEFRTKLIDSGWFTNVVVEEQTPTPDRRVTVRMTADLNPLELRRPLPAEKPDKNARKSSGAESAAMMPPPEPMMMTPPPVAAPAPVEMSPAAPSDGPDPSQAPRGRRGRGRAGPPPEL